MKTGVNQIKRFFVKDLPEKKKIKNLTIYGSQINEERTSLPVY